MSAPRSLCHLLFAAGLLLAVPARALAQAAPAPAAPQETPKAQEAPKTYEPHSGQEGKDVVWVPTSDALVQKMLDLAHVTADDFVIDLGSGDGRTVIAAAKRGATALGIEFNPDMVALSKQKASEAGVTDKTTFVKADLFASDFSKATVITMFLLPDINLRLRPQILDMPPGTRVVSNSFRMGEWEPDQQETITECSSWCTALLWIVPAKVAGSWKTPSGPLVLEQQFQTVTGTLGGTPISGGKLSGDQLSFQVGDVQYVARVNGTSMDGKLSGGSTANWTASRN